MTYLVTGAAGFIGSRVAQMLLEEGHTVVGLDNLNTAYDVRLKEWRLQQLRSHLNFHFHHLSIGERKPLFKLFATSFEAVINLAARAGVRQSVETPQVYLETNVIGTLNLLECCRQSGMKKFVLASTSSLYSDQTPRPFREDADTNAPRSPYAASKKAAETLCYTYHHLYGIDITVLRYFTVYGPAGRPDTSLFRFTQWISEGRPVLVFGNGRQERDFTYVDDIARGTLAALKPVGYEIVNLGSHNAVVLMDAIRFIEKLVGKPAQLEFRPRHPADIQASWAHIEKARRLLRWQPQHPFRKGVANLVNWYRENRAWAKDIDTR